MAAMDRSVLVLYGSETGNAQDMAEELGRLCTRLRFKVQVDELDAVDLVRFPSPNLHASWLTPVAYLECPLAA